jgi:hypothetical protein
MEVAEAEFVHQGRPFLHLKTQLQLGWGNDARVPILAWVHSGIKSKGKAVPPIRRRHQQLI